MTDTEHSPHPPAAGSSAGPESGPPAPDQVDDVGRQGKADAASRASDPPDDAVARPRARRWVLAAIGVPVALALILAVALYAQNQQYQALRADLIHQHAESVRAAQETQSQAAQALALAKQQAAQVQDLRSTLDSTNGQVQDLVQALQTMTDSGSDLMLLNDIDRLASMAQQQLGLGGNVANAIVALEAAQAELARANRPSLAALQQSINGDLDRLRAVATTNVPALAGQIDRLSDLIASAPLLVPDAAAHAVRPATKAPAGPSPGTAAPQGGHDWRAFVIDGWGKTQASLEGVVRDLRGLFEIRRVDDTAALLMSSDQALRFREGLKQRTVTAQLALMMHQPRIWQTELAQVARAIDQRYDMRAEPSRQALKLARELHDTPIETQLPSLGNTLDAIEAAREAAAAAQDAKHGGPDDDDADPNAAPASRSPVSTASGRV